MRVARLDEAALRAHDLAALGRPARGSTSASGRDWASLDQLQRD